VILNFSLQLIYRVTLTISMIQIFWIFCTPSIGMNCVVIVRIRFVIVRISYFRSCDLLGIFFFFFLFLKAKEGKI
jgi:hypothetical protein